MAAYLIPKKPYLKMLKSEMRLEYGLVDLNELLENLLEGIVGDKDDIYHIQDLAFGDLFFQDHHEPFTLEQQNRLDKLFNRVRKEILDEFADIRKEGEFLFFRKTDSPTSLCFEIVE